MKKFLFLLLPLSIILSSCGTDPIKYNDQLVQYIGSSGQRIINLNNEINNLFNGEDHTKLKEYTTATIDSLKSDIKDINDLKKPEGADEFQNAVITYIESLISNAETMEEQYSKITEETTDEEFEELNKYILNSKKIYNEKFEEVISAQKSFAKEKNIDLVQTGE